jgi:hypothetical protein
LKFKVQNDLIHCQEEAEEEETDEHLHSHFLGPKFSHSLEQIALLDWLNLIVSRTIPERSAISSEGGKYITCRLHLKTQVKRMQAYLEKHHIMIHGGEESSIEHLHSPWSL